MLNRPTNEDISDVLGRVADLLEAQGANPYRIRAYRRSAKVVERSERGIAEIADGKGETNLEDLPGIGKGIAGSIREFVHTGRLIMLERLEGQVSPEDLFTTIPGIGEELAHRIHAALHIETLEELELAAHDGRLEKVSGLGDRRISGLRDSLAGILIRSSRRRARLYRGGDRSHQGQVKLGFLDCPSIETVLEVERSYRQKVNAGNLKTITPRRFNPEGKASLPILHTEMEGWHFTALFSNTARAHELGRTRDWVVIYFEKDGHENQVTVVTEHQGPMKGKRVVRGYERECRIHYSQHHGL